MLIIPALDLLDGRAVRLVRGEFDQPTDFGDPVEWLTRWREEGAVLVHVVDLSGARAGKPMQSDLIERLVTLGVDIEVGGGIREQAHVEQLLNAGVARVVLGTIAMQHPDVVAELAEAFGDAIVVSIDAREGMVATHGWLETSEVPASHLAKQLAAYGVQRFLVTDVGRDGTLTEPNYDLLRDVMVAGGQPVIASGGVTTVEAVSKLSTMGVESAIIGRALYEGVIDFRTAHEAAHAG